MKKVALVGGPGSGKTTLANALTAELKSRGLKWYNVQEYAREHIDRWGAESVKRASDVLLIAYQQVEREKKVNKNADGFVTDSPLILPWFYGRNLEVASAGEKYMILTRLYKMFVRSFLDYDLVVHVKREKPYVKDGCRFQTEEEAKEIDLDVVEQITKHDFPMVTVDGTTDERVEKIVGILYPVPKARPASDR